MSWSWSPDRVRGVGTAALAGAAALTLAALLAMVRGAASGTAPPLAPLAPAAAVAAVAGWSLLVRFPVAHLTALLAGFVLLFNSEPGIQTSEALFGVYYIGYLAVWAVRRVAFGEARIVRDGLDLLLILFLALVTAQALAAPVYGGDVAVALNQWRCMLVLALYFPIRETVRARPEALVPIVGAFLVAALYLALRNLYLYYSALQSAEALYQLAFNRAREGERLYAVALLGAVAFAVRPGTRPTGVAVAFLIALTTGGAVVAGMSRTVWVAVLPALASLLVMFRGREWRAVGVFLGITVVGLVTVVPLVVGDALEAIRLGLSIRAGSIATSATEDLSLINRFYEWRAAIDAGLASPVLGRGLGVPYSYFDVLRQTTVTRPFNHSTYVGVFYRHGLVGLGLLLGVYGWAAARALRLARAETGRRRTLALVALSALVLLSISISTEGALIITDGAYVLMYPLAVVGGLWWSRGPDA